MNLQEMQKRWPLFEIKQYYNEYAQKDTFRAYFEPGHSTPSYSFWTVNEQALETLDREHRAYQIRYDLQKRYPNLHFYIDRESFVPTALWVERDGRDAESIASNGDGFKEKELIHWNQEAGKALQEGWFFCTGHQRAEPKSQYAFFHFAGSYCETYKQEYPEHYKQAKAENYN